MLKVFRERNGPAQNYELVVLDVINGVRQGHMRVNELGIDGRFLISATCVLGSVGCEILRSHLSCTRGKAYRQCGSRMVGLRFEVLISGIVTA